MPKFNIGEPIIYQNGNKFELGIVKSICEINERHTEQCYFVNYHTGDTAACTPEHTMHKIVNKYAFLIERKREE